MKSIHTLALTTLAAAMAAGTAFAQQPTTPRTTQSQAEQTQETSRTQQHTQERQQSQMGARDYGRDHDGDKHKDKPSYREINTRGDDRVTRADLSAHPRLVEYFDDIDSDGDGAISRSEYETWKSDKESKDDKDRSERRSEY